MKGISIYQISRAFLLRFMYLPLNWTVGVSSFQKRYQVKADLMSTSSSAVPKITSRQLFGINKSARMLDRTTSLKPFLSGDPGQKIGKGTVQSVKVPPGSLGKLSRVGTVNGSEFTKPAVKL